MDSINAIQLETSDGNAREIMLCDIQQNNHQPIIA
jgi:hypothetical protein